MQHLKLSEKSQLIGSKQELQNAKREPLCKRQRLTIKSQEEDLQTTKDKENFRRNLKLNLRINTTSTSKTIKKCNSECIKDMLVEMKNKVTSSRTNTGKKSNLCSESDYIFINPNGLGSSKRCPKEKKINEFLNELSIFQLNIDAVLNDYKF